MRLVMARRLMGLVLISSLFFGLMPAAPASALTPLVIRTAIESKINAARVYRGLKPLKITTALHRCDAAAPAGLSCMQYWSQDHARRMGLNRDYYHDTPSRLWAEVPKSSWWRAENVGYVTSGTVEAHRMHTAFMNSAGHRENILSPRATHMAIGVYVSGGKVWVVQRFADLTR